MSLEAWIPLWTTRLTLVGGSHLLVTPMHDEIAWLDASPEALAAYVSRVSEKTWSRSGELAPWLDVAPPLALVAEQLTVALRPPKESRLPSPLELSFHVLVGPSADGSAWLGFVPALALGAAGADAEGVRESLRATIRLEFLRSERLASARKVLSTQWYDHTTTASRAVDAQAVFYTFSELRALKEAEQEKQLPSAATALRPQVQRVYAVEAALAELQRALASPYARCVLLIGPAGVGKSALVEELARRAVPELDGKTLWETTAARLERTLTASTGWQDNLSQVCAELAAQGDWLYVRSLSELFEVGRYVGNDVSMAEYLRPRLQEGSFGFLSECTAEQVARIEARYPGYLDSFRRVVLEEPGEARLVEIGQARAAAEAGAAVPVDADAVAELIRLQRRFSPYSGFPGRPVRFLEALALSLRTGPRPSDAPPRRLDREAMLHRFCEETGMPRALIDPRAALAVDEMEAFFAGQVFGQPAACQAVVEALVTVRAGLTRPRHPIATLLFVGPTGVGKTETARALAAFMFGSRDRMIRFDMSEFASPGAAIRLTEGPGGEGRLTAAVRREPFSVLLLDEIEKADPMVFDLLLQVLGEGRLSDGRGRVADFCSSLIIMTSNIGASEASVAPSGFGRGSERKKELLEVFRTAAERHFRPEFFNRIDRVVAFSPLSPDAVEQVLDRELRTLAQRPGLHARRADLSVTPAARAHLAAAGYDPAYGARQLQRTLRHQLSAPLARSLNAHPTPHPVDLAVDLVGSGLRCTLSERRPDRAAQGTAARFEEVADALDDERRTCRKIFDGARYAALLSELQYLTRRQRRLGQRFWQEQESAARLGLLQQVVEDAVAMDAQITAVSTASVLEAMDGAADPAPFEAPLRDYRAQAGAVQRAIYDAASDADRVAVLGIYGDAVLSEALGQVYVRVAEALEHRVSVRRLWLRKPPGERGEEPLPPVTEGRAERERAREEREALFRDLPMEAPPREDCARALGVELELRGCGVADLFEREIGVHAWTGRTNEDRLLGVVVARCDRDTYIKERRPDNLHRKSFTEDRPRRTVGGSHVVDRVYREDAQDAGFLEPGGTLQRWLRDRFAAQIIEDLTS